MDNLNNTIKEAATKLLTCADDFFIMKQSVEVLYHIFKDITSIDINKLSEGEIMLPTGKAISPSSAAHCLLEMKRTAIFLRGIKKAIDSKIQAKGSTIHILYAGTGPYATLITPLLTLYKHNNVKITLLDINKESLDAVNKLITQLSLSDYIDDYILADASTHKIDKDYDIVISETMQMCLQNEPQVAIMQNLIPQLKKDALFIPQRITIDAYLRNPGYWNEEIAMHTGMDSKFLSELFFIDKSRLDDKTFRKTIKIPEFLNGYIELMLHTTIIVFDDEILNTNDCSLNMPKKYYEFREAYAKAVEFWYELSDKPIIESKVVEFA